MRSSYVVLVKLFGVGFSVVGILLFYGFRVVDVVTNFCAVLRLQASDVARSRFSGGSLPSYIGSPYVGTMHASLFSREYSEVHG